MFWSPGSDCTCLPSTSWSWLRLVVQDCTEIPISVCTLWRPAAAPAPHNFYWRHELSAPAFISSIACPRDPGGIWQINFKTCIYNFSPLKDGSFVMWKLRLRRPQSSLARAHWWRWIMAMLIVSPQLQIWHPGPGCWPGVGSPTALTSSKSNTNYLTVAVSSDQPGARWGPGRTFIHTNIKYWLLSPPSPAQPPTANIKHWARAAQLKLENSLGSKKQCRHGAGRIKAFSAFVSPLQFIIRISAQPHCRCCCCPALLSQKSCLFSVLPLRRRG